MQGVEAPAPSKSVGTLKAPSSESNKVPSSHRAWDLGLELGIFLPALKAFHMSIPRNIQPGF